MNFTHLHVHSMNSLLDGLGSTDQYVQAAKKLGMTHLAITDHGNIDCAVQFQKSCEKHGINPIFGAELYIVEDRNRKEKGETRAHITLLVKNITGWVNLLKMISISNLEGFYYRPRIDVETLLWHCDGLVIMTACTASLLNFDWGKQVILDLVKFKKEDIYVEIMPHIFKEQKEFNERAIQFAQENGFKIVATNDCHYIDKNDEKSQEVLLAVQSRTTWENPNRWKFKGSGYYLRSRGEMSKAFKAQGTVESEIVIEALQNTGEVAEKCGSFRIEKKEPLLPKVPKVEGDDDEYLKKICASAFHHKIEKTGKHVKRYQKRLNEELGLIIKSKFSRYFLIVWELVNWCKQNDIMVGPGRGSSGGSLVCYLLGITQVDPIEYNLVFARFISPERNDLPDIDLDFEDVKRPLIRKHLEETYGKDNVAGISTFSVLKGRSALRDVGRVFAIPLKEVDRAAKSIPQKLKGEEGAETTIKDAFETFEDGIAFKKKYPEVAKIAINIEGTIRQKGQHAAAVIISDEKLTEGTRSAFCLGKDKEPIINWDKEDIEYVGLMKLDVLGLNMLSIFHKAQRLIKLNHGEDIYFVKIPMDDRKCFEEFSKGNNIGCFQVGSPGLRKFCQQLGIDNFMMLVHATSLFRPGTLRSGMAETFIKRKNGEEEVPEMNKIVAEITSDTFGVIIYQEQVMRLVYELSGLGWSFADKIRKVIAKSQGEEKFRAFEDQFVAGCLTQKTISEDEAVKLWNDLSTMGSYSFNLSHAVCYSFITYWDMWLKIHYPVEFICASLQYGADLKKDELIEEAFRLGLDVRPPKVGISKSHDWVIEDKILYMPFIEIKGVGEKTAAGFARINKKGNFYESDKKEKKPQSRFLKVLDEINAYEDVRPTKEEAGRISEYLSISLVNDTMYKYKKLIKLISSTIEIHPVKSVNNSEPERRNKWYLAEVSEIKLKLRNGSDGSRGTASGTMKDEEDYCRIAFNDDLYERKKEFAEHCEGKFILARGEVPKRKGNLIINDAWFMDEIIAGELEGLDLNLARGGRFKNKELQACEDCPLRKECRQPVMPSSGRFNIMVIGEAPGRDEDKLGMGFVGKAGEILWETIDSFGFERKDFTVTNVVKCYPSETKTPTLAHVKACSKWLTEEIKNIQPFMVLALGNTGLKFFHGLESGITNRNGLTEWNEKFGCWISWALHPASVIYSPDNLTAFTTGIENFIKKVEILGGV